MSHERLAQLMQARQNAIAAGQEPLMAQETILSIFRALDQGDITAGRALRLLRYQAVQADKPPLAALYRQAAAAIRQMQREEH